MPQRALETHDATACHRRLPCHWLASPARRSDSAARAARLRERAAARDRSRSSDAGDALLDDGHLGLAGHADGQRREVVPDAPERYTLEFQPGGRVNVRADCNRGSGSYLLNGSTLTFGPIALTRAMCPPGSKDAEFLKGLAAVSGHEDNGSELVLTFAENAGSMRFRATDR